MTKRYIFGWRCCRHCCSGDLIRGVGRAMKQRWLDASGWLRSVAVSHTSVTVLVLVCYSVNTTWQGAIKLDRHQSIFFKTQKQSVCRKATSRYLHAFESFINKNCDAWLVLVDIACFENKLWMEWYCMVLSCIDTIELILSDWRDTCAGPTEYL